MCSPVGRTEMLHRARGPRWDTELAGTWPLMASSTTPWGLSFLVHLILSILLLCR